MRGVLPHCATSFQSDMFLLAASHLLATTIPNPCSLYIPTPLSYVYNSNHTHTITINTSRRAFPYLSHFPFRICFERLSGLLMTFLRITTGALWLVGFARTAQVAC